MFYTKLVHKILKNIKKSTLGNVTKLRRVHLGHLKKKIEKKKNYENFFQRYNFVIFSEVDIRNIKKPICSYKK